MAQIPSDSDTLNCDASVSRSGIMTGLSNFEIPPTDTFTYAFCSVECRETDVDAS